MIHHKSAAQINQHRAILHRAELIFAKQILIRCLPVDVQRDHVRSFQQFSKAHWPRISPRQHMRHIVKHNPHAHRFGQIRNLRANFPYPTIPSVSPRTSCDPADDLFQTPACSCVLASNVRRISRMISPIASSATDREFECGSLNTPIPRSLEAARSILSTPIQNAPTETNSGAASKTAAVIRVFKRTPRIEVPRTFSISSALFQRPLQRLDLKPRFLKLRPRHSADVLQQ